MGRAADERYRCEYINQGMLTNTFCHIPSVGLRTELKLWEAGIRSWELFLEMDGAVAAGPRGSLILDHVHRSQEALVEGDIPFFTTAMPSGEHWRVFPEFRNRTAYLDIETTGLEMSGVDDGITTIALYDGSRIRQYVRGENLRDFADDISAYDLLVTYNGKCFDIPFIEQYFRIKLEQPHIDLRYVLGSLGFRGGLKGCERQLGIDRGELQGVDGFFAVLLWREYCSYGDPTALETLLAYNIEDTVNLERLMLMAYNLKVEETPFAASHRMEIPASVPASPFRPNLDTIERVRQRYQAWSM